MEDGDEDDAIPGVLDEERPDRRDDEADADGCGGCSGGCRVLISLARAGGVAAALSAVALPPRLPLLRSRTDSCSKTGTGSISGSAREGAETVALMSCSRRLRSTMSDTSPISGELEEMRTWLSASAEGTDGSGAPAVVASPARPETALDDGGARGCPVVEVVFTEL